MSGVSAHRGHRSSRRVGAGAAHPRSSKDRVATPRGLEPEVSSSVNRETDGGCRVPGSLYPQLSARKPSRKAGALRQRAR